VESETLLVIGIVAVVAVVAAVLAWRYLQRQRRARLRERFGPEYERALRETGNPEKATAVLEDRVSRVGRLKIHALSRERAEAFGREWKRVQAMFVDDPGGAVDAADRLVTEVMAARGYPLEDFETRAADLSVDHPRVVENYRTARALAVRRTRGEAATEELRRAVVNYRALFDDLLETGEHHRHLRRAS
jgi:hypothetical protein